MNLAMLLLLQGLFLSFQVVLTCTVMNILIFQNLLWTTHMSNTSAQHVPRVRISVVVMGVNMCNQLHVTLMAVYQFPFFISILMFYYNTN